MTPAEGSSPVTLAFFFSAISTDAVKTNALVCRRRSSGSMYRRGSCKARSSLHPSCSAGLKSRRVPASSDSLGFCDAAFWTPFAMFRTFCAGRCKSVASQSFAAVRAFPAATGQFLAALDRVAGVAAGLATEAHQSRCRDLGIAVALNLSGMRGEVHSSLPTLEISNSATSLTPPIT